MKRPSWLNLVKWCGVATILLTFVAGQSKDSKHKPDTTENFIAEMLNAHSDIQQMRKENKTVQQIHQRLVEYHLQFTRNYPIYYDWWLQDATYDAPEDPHKWYWCNDFATALSIRMANHKQPAVENNPEAVEKAFKEYL